MRWASSLEKDMKLVTVAKNGDCLDVHPDTLAEHQKLGWVVCEREEVVAEGTATDESQEAPKRRGRPPKKAE